MKATIRTTALCRVAWELSSSSLSDVAVTVSHHGGAFSHQLLTREPTDETTLLPRKFLVQVAATLETLRKQEDTDGDWQITIEDSGPKVSLKTMHTQTMLC